MITVVIPTMWRYKPFVDFLIRLRMSKLVDQIILIDNDPSRRALNGDPCDKLKIITNEENIGVNPAWNIGVELSRNEIVCIMNDDIVFDMGLFETMVNMFHSVHNYSLIMHCPGDAVWGQPVFETGNPKVGEYDLRLHGKTFGFGQLFFVKKTHWQRIPDDLKIYYGDNWVFETQQAMGNKIGVVHDVLHYTPYAQTTKELKNVQELLSEEGKIYNKQIDRFRLSVSINSKQNG